MPRKHYSPNSEFPFHITGRAHNKNRYPLPLDVIWKIMSDELWLAHHLYNLKIHAFVLMPNHFHLLASTPDANLSSSMHLFMGQTSKIINLRSGKLNQTFGNRYYRTLINNMRYYDVAYKYVYRNPVKAKLSDKVENYQFSSLQMLLGLQHMSFPVERDHMLMDQSEDVLSWLNRPPPDEAWTKVKTAMRHSNFYFRPDAKSRRKIEFNRQNF